MVYKLKVMIDFIDVHTKQEYIENQEILVSEERALELFSSDYHLVKFVERNEIEFKDDENMEEVTLTTDNQLNMKQEFENLEEMNFLQLKKLAEDKGLNTSLVNSKEKLRELIRNNKN